MTPIREILDEVDKGHPPLNRDWYDIPMRQTGPAEFSVTLGLCDTGHFSAKCYFLPSGAAEPVWPEGRNTCMNVSAAHACCANIIYNAFVRQFGPNRSGKMEIPHQQAVFDLDQTGWAVIPPSGKFRDLIKELDFIVDTLGCRYIQLLPIHPTPTTYGRMGRFGSPYAALDFMDVDPALAEFDPAATPMQQFLELVDEIHRKDARILLDIAINHTGWAASLHESHPQWLSRSQDGRIENPGAWGVKWEDLTKLDFSQKDLWQYMANVFLRWCKRGVDGFRCDAGYMIPLNAWRYIIAAVRRPFPDTLFLLEGLGGKVSVTRSLLDSGNFDWAYSEVFQNYDRDQLEWYLPQALDICRTDGILVNFAETHDNNRLAARSVPWALMRTALLRPVFRKRGLCIRQWGGVAGNG